MLALTSLSRAVRQWVTRSPLLVQLLRQGTWYVAAGVAATGIHAGLFLLLREPLGTYPANISAIVVSTVANTEFHHYVTFNARGSSRLRRLVAIAVTIAFYATYSSTALAVLQLVVPDPSAAQQTTTIVAAALVFGLVRFVLLRVWVFARTSRSRRRARELRGHR
ncbi:GtrA family protein [Haloechinothrix sp. YIM 98757]|uniref:GtrA family protein n=1 Tax=Haloechinothrix aidingensis TaxID=2752311 RepID=A0A838ABT5_9PSEU|nr:GtrA family protein [Haloechinothrix aidingensis]MBA0126697.1 GtrA family protein [Haloechinothrix aidingensis]